MYKVPDGFGSLTPFRQKAGRGFLQPQHQMASHLTETLLQKKKTQKIIRMPGVMVVAQHGAHRQLIPKPTHYFSVPAIHHRK
jgi:hypothetical protein